MLVTHCSIADASVYPASIELHNKAVNMIASLWHAPEPKNGGEIADSYYFSPSTDRYPYDRTCNCYYLRFFFIFNTKRQMIIAELEQ